MAMRVTQGVTNRSYLYNLNTAQYSMNKSSEKMQTGRKFSRVSEDVHGAAKLMKLRTQLNRNEGVQESVNLALSDLEMTEGILTDMKDITTEVQAEMLKAMNEPTLNASNETFVTFLQESKKEILRLANKQYNDKYLLGGQNNNEEPFSVSKNGLLMYHDCIVSGITTSLDSPNGDSYYEDSLEYRKKLEGLKNSTSYDPDFDNTPVIKVASEYERKQIENDIKGKKDQITQYYNKMIKNTNDQTEKDLLRDTRDQLVNSYNETFDPSALYVIDINNKDEFGSPLYAVAGSLSDYNSREHDNITEEYYYESNGKPIEFTHNNFIDIGLDMSSKNISKTSKYNVTVDGIGMLGYGKNAFTDCSNNIYDMMTEMEKACADKDVDRLTEVFDQFKKQCENLITGRAEIGVRTKYLESTVSRLENENALYEESKNRVEAVDDALEITRFKGYQSAWNTVLQFGGSIFPKSLMDYVN